MMYIKKYITGKNRTQSTNACKKWIKYTSDMQLLHKEGDTKNVQNSEQKLLTNISHPHSPLKIEASISRFIYF